MRRLVLALAFALGPVAAGSAALLWAGDGELSVRDKQRILYSSSFSFTEGGYPLVTVEIMSGQTQVELGGADGVVVLPDGDGGPEIRAGAAWTVHAEATRPALLREWTVVDRYDVDDRAGIDRAVALWTKRGHDPRTHEIGTVFGVAGEVVDSREVLVTVAPAERGAGAANAGAIAARWQIETTVHTELVDRPTGTLVATSADGAAVIRNPGVLWFAAKDPEATLTVADVVAGRGGSQLDAERREDRRYFGRIYVTLGEDGRLVVVNAIASDRLLAGLVPSEIFPDAPFEALAAQAIAARTELLSRIGTRHHTDPYLLCSSQHCQVYAGAGKEHPRTTRAVTETRGQVLLRAGGGLVDARYSAACGGHSEDNETVWGGAPDPSLRGSLDVTDPAASAMDRFARVTDRNVAAFLRSAPDQAYCGASKYAPGRHRWTVQKNAGEIDALIATAYPGVGSVRALEPVERGVSGRIKQLRIRGVDGEAVAQGDLHIRRLLGGLKSTLFTVRATGPADRPETFVFSGGGFGHGVGLCQLGAIGRAERGQDHEKILRHYYPGSRTYRLY
jgi:SpoIID/LytB domain protein